MSVIGTLITAGALYVAVNNFKKQLQLQFFSDYTKRYQEITLNLPERINESDFNIPTLDQPVRERTLRYMRAYFDLCSEEYFLWRGKNISNNTWNEWKSGILFALSKPAFKQAWEIIKLDTVHYNDFANFIKSNTSKKMLN